MVSAAGLRVIFSACREKNKLACCPLTGRPANDVPLPHQTGAIALGCSSGKLVSLGRGR